MQCYYVYILANKRNGTLYIGVTNDLIRRVHEHKTDIVDGFSNDYGTHKLVYYEQCENVTVAIEREKRLKHWKRGWKLELIEKQNPYWRGLYNDIV